MVVVQDVVLVFVLVVVMVLAEDVVQVNKMKNVVVWNVVLLAFFVVQTVVKMEVVVEEGVAQSKDVAVVVKMDVVLEDVALFAIVFVLLEDVAMIPVVQKDVVLVLTIRKFY